MGLVVQGPGGSGAGVGAEAFAGLHARVVPLSYGSLGHYRTAVKLTMATSQAAPSRLFEIRNGGSNLIVLTRLYIAAAPSGTITTAYTAEFALWRCTGFSAIDNTNTVTPTGSVRRTSMTAYPGGAVVRHVTVAGAANGMTGGTLTKDGNEVAALTCPMVTFAAASLVSEREFVDDMNGTHPLVFAANEGFIIENVVVGSGTANVAQVVVDCSWAEVVSF